MTSYITKTGDTWDKISFEQYGSYHIEKLVEANLEHVDTVIFSGGIELNIPEIERTTVSAVPWR